MAADRQKLLRNGPKPLEKGKHLYLRWLGQLKIIANWDQHSHKSWDIQDLIQSTNGFVINCSVPQHFLQVILVVIGDSEDAWVGDHCSYYTIEEEVSTFAIEIAEYQLV